VRVCFSRSAVLVLWQRRRRDHTPGEYFSPHANFSDGYAHLDASGCKAHKHLTSHLQHRSISHILSACFSAASSLDLTLKNQTKTSSSSTTPWTGKSEKLPVATTEHATFRFNADFHLRFCCAPLTYSTYLLISFLFSQPPVVLPSCMRRHILDDRSKPAVFVSVQSRPQYSAGAVPPDHQ
jgi:hypothetical protein